VRTIDELESILLTTDGKGIAAKKAVLTELLVELDNKVLRIYEIENQFVIEEKAHWAVIQQRNRLREIVKLLSKELGYLVKIFEPLEAVGGLPVPGYPTLHGARKALAEAQQCPFCNVALKPSIALAQTWVAGAPDFIGETYPSIQTMSPGGPGKVINCMKCPECGYSTT